MNIRFLGQGFADISDESVGQLIIDSFGDKAFNKFLAIVAFASEGGIKSIYDHIKSAENNYAEIIFFVGIDQKVTSREALSLLLESEVNSYVYHTVSHIIFHPKIYIFEGEKQGRIIIGSSNLTLQGLFQNMEASLVIDFEMTEKQGVSLLNQIKNHYRFLLDKTSPNVQQLTRELIEQLVDAEVIPEEKERREVSQASNKPTQNQALLSEIKKMFPAVSIPKRKNKSQKKKAQKTGQKPTSPKGKLTLVWQKNNLPSSDAQQVSNKDKKPMGVLRFTQAKFKVNGVLIDQKTYFRKKVFDKLEWTKKSDVEEEAFAYFKIEIEGKSKGTFRLPINHKPDKETTGTTRLYWRKAMSVITEQDNSGKTLSLFRIESEPDSFLIKIE